MWLPPPPLAASFPPSSVLLPAPSSAMLLPLLSALSPAPSSLMSPPPLSTLDTTLVSTLDSPLSTATTTASVRPRPSPRPTHRPGPRRASPCQLLRHWPPPQRRLHHQRWLHPLPLRSLRLRLYRPLLRISLQRTENQNR